MPQIEGETYFNNFEQSGYEEMKDWTPDYYQAIKEGDANLQFAGKTIDQMAQSLEDWCANMFIDTMGDEALSRMEAFYYMEENASRPIEERRRLLKAAQLGSGKINRDRIGRMVESYTGVYPTFEFIHRLEIKAGLNDEYTLYPRDLTKFLRKNIPAHLAFVLIFDIWVIIDSHDLEQITIPGMTIRCEAPMWDYPMFDGSWDLDGSRLLDGLRAYALAPGMNAKFSITEPEGGANANAAVHAFVESAEGLEAGAIKMLLDIEEGSSEDAALSMAAGIEDDEGAVGQISVTVFSTDYVLLDGSLTLNGSRDLDSIYRKEIVD